MSTRPTAAGLTSNGIRVFSNVVARRRDERSNPIPRRHVYLRPLLTCDAKAAAEAAEGIRSSPLLWLKMRSALACSENCERLRAELEERLSERNARRDTEIAATEVQLEAVELRLAELAPEAAAASAALGWASTTEPDNLSLAATESVGLDELSGIHHLPPPEAAPSRFQEDAAKVLSILGGAVFGLSLGLLTGTLALAEITEEAGALCLWCAVGAVVMLLVGSVLVPLARFVGATTYTRTLTSPRVDRAVGYIASAVLLSLAVVFITVEAKTEQLGLFRALTEESSLTGFRLARPELLLVSLMLSIPAVFAYIVRGFGEGQRLANLCRLKALLHEERARIRALPEFTRATRLREHARLLLTKKVALEQQLSTLRGEVETGLPPEDFYRLEDCEMDAAAASWAVEDELRAAVAPDDRRPRGCLLGPLGTMTEARR
jgi:hypothetical protein